MRSDSCHSKSSILGVNNFITGCDWEISSGKAISFCKVIKLNFTRSADSASNCLWVVKSPRIRLCSLYAEWLFVASGKVYKTPIRYVTPHLRDRRVAASLCHKNCAATTVLVGESNPYPVWFSWKRESYSVNGNKCSHFHFSQPRALNL